jgi:DNA topoisomerase-1
VTDGTTNASIPKTTSPDALTYAQAAELLEARKGAVPSIRRARPRRRNLKAATAQSSRRKAVGA